METNNLELETLTDATLAEELYIRSPRLEESEAVAAMIRACDEADGQDPEITAEDIQTEWRKPGFDLKQDAWVVVAPASNPQDAGPGEVIAGYQEVWNREGHALLNGDGYVHPLYRGMGVGTAMLRRMEVRARQHIPLADPNRRVAVRNGTLGTDLASHELHKNEGYQPIRFMWRMEIDMEAAPPAPIWPDGIALRPFDLGRDTRPVFDALHEAFRDHWGYVPWNFEWWQDRTTNQPEFDPNLYFVAWDTRQPGGQIAGAALCNYRVGKGWVSQIGVRRPYRRMGLGLALLNHALGEFYRRGDRLVGLGVDASNPTGATRLYEKAGLHVAHEYVVFEKELRPGEEWQIENE